MKNLKKTLAVILASALTTAIIAVPVSAERDGMHFSGNLPSSWYITSEAGELKNDHAGVFYRSEDKMEIIMYDIVEWSGLNSVTQNSDSAWEEYLVEHGRFSDSTIAEKWEQWYPNDGGAVVVTDSQRTTHETVNGYNYVRFDRDGKVYMSGRHIANYATTTYLYAQNNCLYALYYCGWNDTTDHIGEFLGAVSRTTYDNNSVASPANNSGNNIISIYVNSSRVYPDSDPVIINDRTLVPIRVVAEALGYDVGWDGVNQIVDIHNGDMSLRMMIGSTSLARYNYDYNGNLNGTDTLSSDVAPQIINDRTYLPLRAVGEGLGATVDWDGSTRSVSVNK